MHTSDSAFAMEVTVLWSPGFECELGEPGAASGGVEMRRQAADGVL